MKLELEHIAPYLSYDLKWVCVDKDSKEYDIISMLGIYSLNSEIIVQVGNYDVSLEDNLENDSEIYKPLLRPLSDIIDEEKDLWIKFSEEFGDTNMDFIRKAIVYSKFCSTIIYDAWKIREILYKMHFDVFNLIEEGLAIDINTLKKE